MGLSLDELEPPLDDVAFLSRSNNRVRILEELSVGDRSRRELREKTGVSRPTLGRILEGFRERAWAIERDGTYVLTPFGRLLAAEFGDLLDTAEAIQTLRDVAPRLPLDSMDFDLRRLASARITTPRPTDASAHFRRETELLEQTSRIRFLCNQAQPETIGRYREWVRADGHRLEATIAGDAIDVASADPEMGTYLRDMLSSDGVALYRYDGPVSIMLGLLDDTASIVPIDDAGVPRAFIESDDESVRAWVTETLASHRDQAERVTLDSIAE